MKEIENYEQIDEAFNRLYPICRSILGVGYRESLYILKDYIPLEDICFYSGEKVLNWRVPKEWVIREAWIKDMKGNVIVDYKVHNLHVVNYSMPVNKVVTLDELCEHIYTSDADENAIPYVFSYYKERWGFCMCKKQLETLKEKEYQVYIDSEMVEGKLIVGETILEGVSKKEVLVTSYLCHPSMANNELSGPLILAMLYQRISKWKSRKYTYRFVINPETIGSICYLSRRGEHLKENMKTGIVLTCLGGDEILRWKQSRKADCPLDECVSYSNYIKKDSFLEASFDPTSGSDERQYCSIGYNLPVGQMARKVYGEYKEYHTSLDDKELMGIENLITSCDKIEMLLKMHEERECYKNVYPYGEIKLGDYDLYPSLNCSGSRKNLEESIVNNPQFIRAVMFILNYADGEHSLYFYAEKLQMDIKDIKKIVQILQEKGLIEEERD